jgi:putative MATE family efflux protein
MVLGISAVVMFQVVDTFYVGMLGADELAAMSFTFPVGFAIMSIAMGLGLGTTATIAQAIGHGDRTRVRRLTTHALLLAVAIVSLVAALGLLTRNWLFGELLGAPQRLLPLIRDYIDVYLACVGFLVVPMVGNSAIRATGDTKTPSLIMVVAGGVNVVLDPLFIFGWGSFPALGLFGAALATAVSWVITFAWAIYVLHRRERMLEWRWPRLNELLDSWRSLLKIGLPAAGSNLLIPLGQMVLTRIAAGFGPLSVAAFGVGTRIESIAMIGVFAMSTALTPFVAQNFGADQIDRVKGALSYAVKCCLLLGAGSAVLLGLLAEPLAGLFSDSATVAKGGALYLQSVPWSYAALGVGVIVPTLLNALSRANQGALLTVARLFLFVVPCSYVGAKLWDFQGLLIGLGVGNTLVGLSSWWIGRTILSGVLQRPVAPKPALVEPRHGVPPLY